VAALADGLALARFALVGESGGGPYALACAHELSERLTAVAVVCGLGPVAGPGATAGIAPKERLGYAIATRAPLLAGRALVPVARFAARAPRSFLRITRWQLEPPDRRALDGPLGDLVAADFAEAFRQGGAGVGRDLALLFRPWPFAPDRIATPVRFLHGALDRTVSVEVARALARAIPGARLEVFEGDGHFSLLPAHADRLLAEL
jgi:pimeloyl-ACP methyl ester carboxylesterase